MNDLTCNTDAGYWRHTKFVLTVLIGFVLVYTFVLTYEALKV